MEKIRNLLEESGLTRARFGHHFVVELVDPSLFEQWFASPVEPEHITVRYWERLRQELVWSNLQQHLTADLIKDVHSINLLRYGPDANERGNPPTIIVSIVPGHPYSDWREAEEEMNNGLLRYRIYDARCLFVPSFPMASMNIGSGGTGANIPAQKAATEALIPDVHYSMQGTLCMGDTLSPAKDEKSKEGFDLNGTIGTLGGFLRLRDRATGAEKGIYAVTNYHVVRFGIDGYQVSKPAADDEPRELPALPQSMLVGKLFQN